MDCEGQTVRTLTRASFEQAIDHLVQADQDLAKVVDVYGPPPMWMRDPGFPTLVLTILEQQVSLASAKAAYDKLLMKIGQLEPEAFLQLDDKLLRRVGFSRQKTRYCRILANAIQDGELPIEDLPGMTEDRVRAELERLTGIGRWTSDVYLLMALGRPDIWPVGDLALAIAIKDVKGLTARPRPREMAALAEGWRPWRAVAARVLWHQYLSQREARRQARRPA